MNATGDKYQLFDDLRSEHRGLLRDDIARRGVMIPVELDENGTILDGHTRHAIAAELGVDCPTVIREFTTEEEKIDYVLKINMARRHLEPYEWGKAFAKLLDARGVKRGAGARNDVTSATTAEVAKELGVPYDTANKRLKQADVYESLPAEAKRSVREGEATVYQAHREALLGVHQERNRAIESGDIEPPVGVYSTIVIDPPWPIGKFDRDVRLNQSKELDYPTMSLDDIASIEIPADDTAHLYLWTTQKFLPAAFGILEGWSFDYLVTMVWHKPGGMQPIGLPQYNCEFCLLGRRKGLPFLDTKAFPTCFEAPRREHSRKPDEFYDLVRRVSPAPRIDMFSREKRDGFDQFGLEATKFDA